MKLGLDIREKNQDDYFNFDRIFQVSIALYNENKQLYNAFKKCTKKYSFNYNTYFDYAIRKIAKYEENAINFTNGLLDIGILNNIYVDEDKENLWNIESNKYNFSFYTADDYYQDYKEILDYMEKNSNIETDCHKNALFLLQYFNKGEAITAKIKNAVNVDFYHSYYRYNEKIADLNNNVVMSEEDYNKIYNPEIISIVNIDNFDEKLKEVNENTTHTLFELLAIAGYQEYKNSIP